MNLKKLPIVFIISLKKNTFAGHHCKTMDIDIVYLWVDGSDPMWRAKKEAFVMGVSCATHEALDEARFVDSDELKYSLRSIELYAPWIRHIYIVTDGQVPSWIDLTNPRISIVDHTVIMPREALPSFSSPAIEWCVDNIPGLSEHFLLANDDTFIGRAVGAEDFFTPQGYPIVRLRKRHKSKKSAETQYMKTLLRAQAVVKEISGVDCDYIPHHNIDAYRLSDFKQCKAVFAELVDKTVNRHFRHDEDLQRAVVSYYALSIGHGEMKLMGRYNRKSSIAEKIKGTLRGRYYYDSRSISIGERDIRQVLNRYNPMLFCLNDNEHSSDEDRKRARQFLEQMFPEKSSFEV